MTRVLTRYRGTPPSHSRKVTGGQAHGNRHPMNNEDSYSDSSIEVLSPEPIAFGSSPQPVNTITLGDSSEEVDLADEVRPEINSPSATPTPSLSDTLTGEDYDAMDEFLKATDGANVHCHDRYGLPPCDDTDDADSEIEVDSVPLQWIFDQDEEGTISVRPQTKADQEMLKEATKYGCE